MSAEDGSVHVSAPSPAGWRVLLILGWSEFTVGDVATYCPAFWLRISFSCLFFFPNIHLLLLFLALLCRSMEILKIPDPRQIIALDIPRHKSGEIRWSFLHCFWLILNVSVLSQKREESLSHPLPCPTSPLRNGVATLVTFLPGISVGQRDVSSIFI